jgi:hypothetical protein
MENNVDQNPLAITTPATHEKNKNKPINVLKASIMQPPLSISIYILHYQTVQMRYT